MKMCGILHIRHSNNLTHKTPASHDTQIRHMNTWRIHNSDQLQSNTNVFMTAICCIPNVGDCHYIVYNFLSLLLPIDTIPVISDR